MKKIDLEKLKVQSFITTFEKNENQTRNIKGGDESETFMCSIAGNCGATADYNTCPRTCGYTCNDDPPYSETC